MWHRVGLGADLGTPGAPALLLIWIACVFVSILVHELGHAIAMRYFGQRARIVLYHFGGLAMNDSFASWDGARRRRTSAKDDLIIYAAGPGLQILFTLPFVFLAVPMNATPGFMTDWFGLPGLDAEALHSVVLLATFDALLWIGIAWAILNLAPLLPLDGGGIMYNIMLMMNVDNAWMKSRFVSVVVGVALGVYFMANFGGINGIMFFMLAAGNWQEIQQGGRGF
jgi:membrane-associated protease RseP (regulator of RpoE activity)